MANGAYGGTPYGGAASAGTPTTLNLSLSIAATSSSTEATAILGVVPSPPPSASRYPVSTSPFYYLLVSTVTGALIDEVPLTNVRYSDSLDGAGTLTATVPVDDARFVNVAVPFDGVLNPASHLEPNRTALVINWQGTALWAGLLRRVRRHRPAQITAVQYYGYLEQRVLADDRSYTSTDQLAIVADLVAHMQIQAPGNIGLQTVTVTNTSPASRTKYFTGNDLRTYADCVHELATLPDGFHWRNVQAWSGTTLVPTLELGAPSVSRQTTASPPATLFFDYPGGNIISYEWEEDGLTQATTALAEGSVTGAGQHFAIGIVGGAIGAGYPEVDRTVSLAAITNVTDLQPYANAYVTRWEYPVVLPTITCRIDLIGSGLGSLGANFDVPGYNIRPGDTARVVINDPPWTAVDTTFLITNIDVDLTALTFTLTLGPIGTFITQRPPSIGGVLKSLDARLRLQESK